MTLDCHKKVIEYNGWALEIFLKVMPAQVFPVNLSEPSLQTTLETLLAVLLTLAAPGFRAALAGVAESDRVSWPRAAEKTIKLAKSSLK